MMTTVSLPASVRLALACMISALAESTHSQSLLLKAETFDVDPGWDGLNNRATDPSPRQIVQNFGFSVSTTNAGGSAGEIGGFITPAGEPAFLGRFATRSISSANGTIAKASTASMACSAMALRPYDQDKAECDLISGPVVPQTLGYSRSLKHLCPALANW